LSNAKKKKKKKKKCFANIAAIGFLSESDLPPYETHNQLLNEGFRDFFYEFLKTGKGVVDRARSMRTFTRFRDSSELSRSTTLSSSQLSSVSVVADAASAVTSPAGASSSPPSLSGSAVLSSEAVDDELDEEEEDDDDDIGESVTDAGVAAAAVADDSDDDDAAAPLSTSSKLKKKKKKKKKHTRSQGAADETSSTAAMPTSRMTPSERRGKVLAEIVATERSYIGSLRKVVQIYIEPIRAAHGTASPIVTADDEVKIFSTIDRLIPINTALADSLEERGATRDPDAVVGDAFLKFTDTLGAYLQYVNMFDLSHDRYTANLKTNKSFRAFCDACAAHELSAGLPLNAYLIMPIQRSPRYVLLLDELVKTTPESHADYEPLTKALRLIRAFTDMLNRRKRELEDAKQLEAMMAKFERVRFRFIVDGRRFVQRMTARVGPTPNQIESDDAYATSLSVSTSTVVAVDDGVDEFAQVDMSDCVLWLFSDVLVCTAPKSIASRKYDVLWHADLALSDVEFAPAPTGNGLYNLRLAEERHLPQPPFSRVVRRIMQYTASGDDGSMFGGLVKGCIDEAKRKLKPPAKERAEHLLHTLVQQADWQLLFAGGVSREYEKGEVIMKFDEDSEQTAAPWRVISGSVTASRSVPGIEKPVVIQTFFAGDVFGEDSFLSGPSMFEYAATSSHTNLVRANPDVLISMLEARPVVAERFYQRCAIAMSYRVVTAMVQTKVERALRFDVCGDLAAAEDLEQRRLAANAAEMERLRKVIDRAVHEHAPVTAPPRKQRELASKKERERAEAVKLRQKFDLPPDELLVTHAPCKLTFKKVTGAKSELFVFQSCIVLPYRSFGLAHRANVLPSDIVTLVTEGGNQIVMESHDPKQARYSRLYLKHVITVEGTMLRDELFKSMNSLWLAASASASERTSSTSSSATGSPSASPTPRGRPVSMGIAEAVARYAPLAPRYTALLLTEVDWQVLFGVANEVVVEPGEVVLQQGHCFRRLYHVQEGELDVMVQKASESGRLTIDGPAASVVGHLSAGAMFGDTTFLNGGGASASIVARVKSRVSWVERRALTPLFDRNALLAGKFYKYVALGVRKRVAVIERRLIDAAVGLARRAHSEELLASPIDGLPTVSALARSGQLNFVLGEVARSSRRVSAITGQVLSANDDDDDDDDDDEEGGGADDESLML
jgi:CRP-like cAMP-binding protein